MNEMKSKEYRNDRVLPWLPLTPNFYGETNDRLVSVIFEKSYTAQCNWNSRFFFFDLREATLISSQFYVQG